MRNNPLLPSGAGVSENCRSGERLIEEASVPTLSAGAGREAAAGRTDDEWQWVSRQEPNEEIWQQRGPA